MRVALVHEYLNQRGGAERVLDAFHELFPDAPVFTIVYDREATAGMYDDWDVRPSILQQLPFGVRKYKWYLPFHPAAIERLNLDGYDLVLSDASAFAKGVITRPDTLHVCYCHTPTRYLWSDTHTYTLEVPYSWLVKRVLPFVLPRLRLWDRLAVDRVDAFLANSRFVADRIRKYYRRDATVVPPPVNTDRFTPATTPTRGTYYLLVSRLRPYKRVDLAIEAFNRLGIPLKIVGWGEEEERLRKLAKPNVEFYGEQNDAQLLELYRGAIALVHPQEEDFGIAAIEAMACGRPVIAYGVGGVRETVVPGVTGTFFDEQSWEALADSVIRFRSDAFDPNKIRKHAEQFGRERFLERIRSFVETTWATFQRERSQASKTLHPVRTYDHHRS